MDRHNRNLSISTIARAHLAACLTTPWLFLDDFGKNEWSPAFESQLFQILDHRKNHRLPLVYSSNAHPSDFSLTISSLNAAPIIGRLLDRTTILELA
jgi:DNA replication protein DnaC